MNKRLLNAVAVGAPLVVAAMLLINMDRDPRARTPVFEAAVDSEFELPNTGLVPQLFRIDGNKLYLGTPGPGGGLHCYSLPDYRLRWSAELGTYHHVHPEFPFTATAYEIASSEDGKRLFAAGSGERTCTPRPICIASLDPDTGEVLDWRDTPQDYYKLYPCEVKGIQVLVAAGHTSLLVLSQEDLSRELLQLQLPAGQEKPLPPSRGGFDRAIGDSLFDDELDTLFITLRKHARVNCYTLREEDGELDVTVRELEAPADPLHLVPLENGELLAVGFASGRAMQFDPASLHVTQQFKVLPHAQSIVPVGGSLVCTSNDYPNTRVRVYGPQGKALRKWVFHGSQILAPLPLEGGNLIALFEPGSMDVVESAAGGVVIYHSVTCNGAIYLVDTASWRVTGRQQLPDGCVWARRDQNSGLVYMQHFRQDGGYPPGREVVVALRIAQ